MQSFHMATVLSIASVCTAIGFAVWAITRHQSRRAEIQSHMQTALWKDLVDKFGTPHDFIAFLQTRSGLRFIDTLSLEQLKEINPADLVSDRLQKGIWLTIPGLTIALIGLLTDTDWFYVGLVLVALGFSFGLSGLVTHIWSNRAEPIQNLKTNEEAQNVV